MGRFLYSLASVLLRWATPPSFAGAVIRFFVFIGLIHLLSLSVEVVLMGDIRYPHKERLIITGIASAPFLALGLYGFRMAYHAREKLRVLAMTDPLTRLPNRRSFLESVSAAQSARKSGYLGILDADRFKQINDTLGHDMGDQALIAIAEIMIELSDRTMTFARLGGEEFGILVTGPDADILLDQIEDRILTRVWFGTTIDSPAKSLSLSGGVTRLTKSKPVDLLLREADAALYVAKANGGGHMTHWSNTTSAMPIQPSYTESLAAVKSSA